jgi:hypothetical protein
MFLAARSARAAAGDASGTFSRFPNATRIPREVQLRDRIELATTSITHVKMAE